MPRIRTFLGIDLGKDLRAHLVSLQGDLATVSPDVKWVEPENLHLTLLFLGEVEHARRSIFAGRRKRRSATRRRLS